MTQPMWLIAHSDGIRRSWLGPSTKEEAEDIRVKLRDQWAAEDPNDELARVTKVSFPESAYADKALEVHRRAAAVRGEDPALIRKANP